MCVTLGDHGAARRGRGRAGRPSEHCARARWLQGCSPYVRFGVGRVTPGEDSNRNACFSESPFLNLHSADCEPRASAPCDSLLSLHAEKALVRPTGRALRVSGPGPEGGGRLRFSARSCAQGCRVHRTKIGHRVFSPTESLPAMNRTVEHPGPRRFHFQGLGVQEARG